MSNSCLFCDIYQTKTDVIFENDYFYARFDRFPVSPGHALVIPKRHVVSLLDISREEQMNLLPAIQGAINIIKTTNLQEIYNNILKNPLNAKMEQFCKAMLHHTGMQQPADGYNIGVNEGIAAGRTIHHLHIQIIPRYQGDVQDYIGGIRHIIPGKGNYR